MHYTGVVNNVVLREHDYVEFDVENGDRGPKAANVKKVTKSEEAVNEE